MAQVFRRVAGRKIEGAIADLDGVQLYLSGETFAIYGRAQANLQAARDAGAVSPDRGVGGGAEVTWGQERDREYGHLDWYVGLDDRNSDFGALSIEFGRADHLIDDSGRTFGGHEGLYILTRAANLGIKRGRRVKTRLRRIRVRKGRVMGVPNGGGPSS
ncbi:hypothetical protein [Salinispora tropica]|uniref:Uncharacterized protein n=1 Tax=Salinispora tropica (strain ATCC BAA-916 / DSM 44818 / JCM 13857 / NBRC 105044 / CNB-440) TaxID=369723 RepID=A4X2C1_SALTO|nr:hypothetical protein [Salinispora tropica]ABP53021.1 hypothetical protein Strop_0538 [Salinispora tropica CNB-440]